MGLNWVLARAGYWLAVFSIAILTACSSQEGSSTASEATKTVTNSDTATMPATGTSPKPTSTDLLSNLALTYPGGALPAERAAAAAEQLSQNPAVLKYNATETQSLVTKGGSFSPQAATTYTVGLSAPVQRAQNTTLFGSYFFSIFPSEMANALVLNPTWNLEGTAFHASLGINPGLAPVYRFRNLINGSYLYTINDGEKNDILANYTSYFTLEGPAWYASPGPAAGYSALYRFRNLTNNTYLFSAYESEKDAIVANYAGIFLLEGISYYVRLAAPLEISLLAGSGIAGSSNGTGSAASFNRIFGMAQDSAGNIFTAETDNHIIRKTTPAGVVTTYAGAVGVSGSTNGSLASARFNRPYGIVIDNTGNLFVSDRLNYVIRRITPAGVVSTFAGTLGTFGAIDGTGSAARFNTVSGLAIDATDNIYAAEEGNQIIRKITSTGIVTTVAGLAGSSGLVNGAPSAARFNAPAGVAVDAAGNLYVTEFFNNTVRKITPGASGIVTTLAGSAIGAFGRIDGTGALASFSAPVGIVYDGAGNLYVADRGNNLVRKVVTATGATTTVLGTFGSSSFVEGLLPSALASPNAFSVRNGELYVGTYYQILKVNGLP